MSGPTAVDISLGVFCAQGYHYVALLCGPVSCVPRVLTLLLFVFRFVGLVTFFAFCVCVSHLNVGNSFYVLFADPRCLSVHSDLYKTLRVTDRQAVRAFLGQVVRLIRTVE